MTTISDLSCDLIEEILIRVHITSLGAVRSTCKTWNTLSKSRLLCTAESKQQFVGFMRKNSKLCSLRCNLHDEEFSAKEISNQVEISPVLVCDGLVLCVTFTRDEDDDIQQGLMVWNPYLGQTRWIQPSRTAYDYESDIYALGYDSNRCNHKILRYSRGECEIYDLKSGSWRILNLDVTPRRGGGCWGWRSASLKGNTYFVDYYNLAEPYTDTFICFDFTRERFGEYLHLPCSHKDNNYYHDSTPISSFGVEIWVTTKIEPNDVLWSNFLKIDLEAIPRFTPHSFFINEDKKRAVLFRSGGNYDYKAAYIIGENNFFKAVNLGEIHDYFPFVCSNSYVPSLVQIKQN